MVNCSHCYSELNICKTCGKRFNEDDVVVCSSFYGLPPVKRHFCSKKCYEKDCPTYAISKVVYRSGEKRPPKELTQREKDRGKVI